jgi:hypothetical protein
LFFNSFLFIFFVLFWQFVFSNKNFLKP